MGKISPKYLAKRLLYSYLALLVVISVLFLFAKSRPGGLGEVMAAGGILGPDNLAEAQEQWAANEPLWRQFLEFHINFHTGDFGQSSEFQKSVFDAIVGRATPTLVLFGAAFISGFIIGPVVGAYLGWYRGSRGDKAIYGSSLLAYSVPSFWLGYLFLYLFYAQFDLLPRNWMFTQFPTFEWTVQSTISDLLTRMALPLLTLVVSTWVGAMVVMRPMIINETNKEYVHLAHAKGLRNRTIMFKHAARNALIPVVTQAIAVISFLIGGSVIIERVFAWRGLGDLLVVAVQNKDTPLVLATFFIFSLVVVVARLLTDVAYTSLDPRIGFGEKIEGRDIPSIHYPGGWKAAWGAVGYVASYLLLFPVAVRNRTSLIEETTLQPFDGNTFFFRQLPDTVKGPTPLTDFFEPSAVSDPEMAGILFYNAQLTSLSIPVYVFENIPPKSFEVNFLLETAGPTLLVLFLVPPITYALTGILATRNTEATTPMERGLQAGAQFAGCVPLAIFSVYLFSFDGPAGIATPNPLSALLFGGVLYPAVFGLLGAVISSYVRNILPSSRFSEPANETVGD